ncbi:MAG: hypothetical protein N3A66_01630, partial [Planctomycetota bacterium]|nr:hypothetical protein [Planctomycetota bacterium]
DYGMYYFKWNGESFTKNVIEYGPIGRTKGCGIHFAVADLRGSGRLDLILPGKDGLWVYYNEGINPSVVSPRLLAVVSAGSFAAGKGRVAKQR